MASARSQTSPAPETTVFGPEETTGGTDNRTWGEWNPTAESIRPVRGRHRVARQRGGGFARSSTVLGVGVMAAVGAGGIATAQEKPPVPILAGVADSLPDVGSLLSDDDSDKPDSPEDVVAATPLTSAGVTAADTAAGTTDAGEALRARIMEQAEQQQAAAEAAERAAAEKAAAEAAAKEAAEQQEKAEAEKEAARKKAEEEAAKKAEAERLAKLAASYSLPTSSYTLTSSFGQSGEYWSSGQHTGLDFAAPTGTPVKAVHGGTITSAGWSGSYGYRIVLQLEDGTEIWYCHLSSMTVTSGEVSTGETIGRVGATGNVTGPHLHLEVRPGGGDPIDPAAWLRSKGLTL
ncbi:M23 family metallopeptidase [Streptomyces sp. GC420]|uniref:M23 family metallopeptidase n=1 Tax=Streptomyces sp. GC420 TaxID=2697568 RepID=UPI0028BDB20D|nr:M23 family metallopeptidase [Streptomyces sp. GC420]